MKIFVVHVNIGCCQNNSDGKMWVVANDKETAKIIAKQHITYPITLVEEYPVENEVIFSSFYINSNKRKRVIEMEEQSWGYTKKAICINPRYHTEMGKEYDIQYTYTDKIDGMKYCNVFENGRYLEHVSMSRFSIIN